MRVQYCTLSAWQHQWCNILHGSTVIYNRCHIIYYGNLVVLAIWILAGAAADSEQERVGWPGLPSGMDQSAQIEHTQKHRQL